MKTPVWAAVCGAIRDELDVRLIVDLLLQARAAGQLQGVVLSTWQGEFASDSPLKAQLQANGVVIIETPPIDEMVGNIQTNAVNYWRQATQLQRALAVIPADAIVLKTRTDRALPATRRLLALLATPNPLPTVAQAKRQHRLAHFPAVLGHQIAAFHPRTNRVFQFADFAFMGYSADLRKLLSFAVPEMTFNRYLNANMLFFINAFVRDYPIVTDYERRIRFEKLIPELDRYTRGGGTAFPEFLQRFYAVYLGILATHFRIVPGQPERLGAVMTPTNLADFFHESHQHHLAGHRLGTMINSSEVVAAFVDQPTWQVDESTRRVLRLLRSVDPQLFERATPSEVADLQQFAQRQDFSTVPWVQAQPAVLTTQPPTYDQSLAYPFPGLTAAEQAELWQTCTTTANLDQALLRFVVTHAVAPSHAAAFLASGAKNGQARSILMMSRLLRRGYLNAHETAELLRVANTQAKLVRQHGGGNVHVAGYVLNRVMYLHQQGLALPAELMQQVDYCLRRYLTPTKSEALKRALPQPIEQLTTVLDQDIQQATADHQSVVRRRLIELALELTGQRRYWQQLQPLFTADEPLNRQAYDYAVEQGLLVQD